MYNGAVTVEGQFGATSVGDFMIQVRAPPKYCTGGTYGQRLSKYSVHVRFGLLELRGYVLRTQRAQDLQHFPGKRGDHDLHEGFACGSELYQDRVRVQHGGDIIVNVKATSEAGVGYVETVGLPLSDYWTDDRDTTTIGATGSIDFNQT